jgi:integrase
MPTVTITARTLPGLACPTDRAEVTYWDDGLPGFGLRCRPNGRAWVVQWRSKAGVPGKRTLGAPPQVTLQAARKAAGDLLAAVRTGADPSAEKAARKAAVPVRTLVDAYLVHQRERLRSRSFVECERHLLVHAEPLHGLRADAVTPRDIVRLLDSLSVGGRTKSMVRASLHAMWVWAIRRQEVPPMNPVAATAKPAEAGSRARVLTEGEVALLWRATGDGSDYSRICRLLLLTGARREEIAALPWAEVVMQGDGAAVWTLPGERAKNGLANVLRLPPFVVQQLPAKRDGFDHVFGRRAGTGYSGWSKSKAAVDARMQALATEAFVAANGRAPRAGEAVVAPWVLHDLRRTFVTSLSEMGIEPHVVEALVNHVSGSAKAGVAGVYNRAAYAVPKAAALARWADRVAGLVGERQPESNVVRLIA